jgi:hypothetical protein
MRSMDQRADEPAKGIEMARRHYIYIPFDCDRSKSSHQDVWDLSERMLNHFLQKDATEHGHILFFGAQKNENKLSKRVFGSDDVLYINAHGNQLEIGTANDDVCIPPGQLAKRLLSDGLKKEIVHIKVAACSSAKGFDQRRGKRGNESYASVFCSALHHNNFSKAVVYGYTGELTTHDVGWQFPILGLWTTHSWVGNTRSSDPSVRKRFTGKDGRLMAG